MKKVRDFLTMKKNGEKIVMLTAYDFPSAKYAEEAGVDMILVGDSLGMVVLGYESTIPVTVSDMIHHTKAVKNGAKETFIVTDMPYMSYHVSLEQTMQHAMAIMQQSSANAVKLEGGKEVILTIEKLVKAGVPVVGHLGLTPQSVEVLGGYFVQGKDFESAKQLIEDAKQIEQAGALALVLECVPHQLAQTVSEMLEIPVIGIGAGAFCDGQVLVYHDLIQYGVSRTPKFVKTFSNVGETIEQSIKSYITEVKQGEFPSQEHTFTMNEEQLKALYGGALV